jgi:ATP-binding cassette, subfamily B, bacterial PglK
MRSPLPQSAADPRRRPVTRDLSKMLDLMSPAQRRRLLLLLPVVATNALIQVVGIASIMPFLALVSNPDSVRRTRFLRWAYETLGFHHTGPSWSSWGRRARRPRRQQRLRGVDAPQADALLVGHEPPALGADAAGVPLQAVRLLPRPEHVGPRQEHPRRGQAGRQRLPRVGDALVAQSISAAFILVLLVLVNPVLALVSFVFLGGSYWFVFGIMRRRLSEAGRSARRPTRRATRRRTRRWPAPRRSSCSARSSRSSSASSVPSRRYARAMAQQQVYAMLPRYAFETSRSAGCW